MWKLNPIDEALFADHIDKLLTTQRFDDWYFSNYIGGDNTPEKIIITKEELLKQIKEMFIPKD